MSRFVQQQVIQDPFVLEILDREAPHAGPGQVRVKITAAGLNPVDWKLAAIPELAEAFGVSAPTGFGNDLAGVIDEVGDGVEGFAVGDRVFGGAIGRAVADHVVLTPGQNLLEHIPDGVDDVVAATVPIAARTADAALTAAGVGEGDVVLIGGAAGGVGVFTVQLARLAGATVVGTASETNHEFLRSLGVIPTTYGEGLAQRAQEVAPGPLTAAIDLQGNETALAALEAGVAADRIATIATTEVPEGVHATGGNDAHPDTLARVAALIASGDLQVPIAATYPVEQIDQAVAQLRGGHVRGKLVVTF